jgi:hypothetical protein
MCQSLRALQQSMVTYAAGFDVKSLTPAQCDEVVCLAAQVEASAASIKALAAARSASSESWRREGYRSASEKLADQAGMSPGAARRAMDAGQRMADQPDVAAAATAGELSLEQAAAVSDGVAAHPSAARDLIEKAKNASMPELNHEVANVKAAHCDQDARRRERHGRRSWRRQTDREGALQAHMFGHPEDGLKVWRMLDPVRRRLIMLRRQAGGPVESLDALDYDALVLLAEIAAGKDGELRLADLLEEGLFPQLNADALAARPQQPLFATSEPPDPGPTGRKKKLAGSPMKVMVRIDFSTFFRGVPLDGELCEIVGYGPVPVSVVKALIETENPVLVGLATNARQLLGVWHQKRRPKAHERDALDFLHTTCAVEGCSARVGLQYDHRVDWSQTYITAFDFMDRLCPHHHRLKTAKNWALVSGMGKRAFVPPDDPRHPRHGPNERPPGPAPPGPAG